MSRDPRYGQQAYKRARAAILGPSGNGVLPADPMCWKGCGRIATTADHVPPVETHGWHLNLFPACRRCNYSAGTRVREAKRAASGSSVERLRRRVAQLEAALTAAGVPVPAEVVPLTPRPDTPPAAPRPSRDWGGAPFHEKFK